MAKDHGLEQAHQLSLTHPAGASIPLNTFLFIKLKKMPTIHFKSHFPQ